MSEEVKRKLRRAMTGKNNPMYGKKRPDLAAFNKLNKTGVKLSIEVRKKMRSSHLNNQLSEEHKTNISRGLKGLKKTPEHIEKIRRAKKGKPINVGISNPMYGCSGLRSPTYGRKHSKETKKKMSEKGQLRVGAKNGFFGKTHSDKTKHELGRKALHRTFTSKFLYRTIPMRSNWEVEFAKWLDEYNYTWWYEPKYFFLSQINKYYIPDFFVQEWDSYVEIKGYWGDKIKYPQLFSEDYPAYNLKCIDQMNIHKFAKLGGKYQ